MEAFEKWLDKTKPTQDEKWKMVNYSWAADQAWRAALEWVCNSCPGNDSEMLDRAVMAELEGK